MKIKHSRDGLIKHFIFFVFDDVDPIYNEQKS